MRIAYLFHWDQSIDSGVGGKIRSQVRYWRRDGHEVELFQLRRESFAPDRLPPDWHIFSYGDSLLDRIGAWQRAADSVRRWGADVVYYRYDLFFPSTRDLARHIPLVVEINTDDVTEYFAQRSSARGCYNWLTRGLVLQAAAGFVFVTRGLSISRRFRQFSKPSEVIANGIELDAFDELPASPNSVPRLVFLGTAGQAWHGVDKILCLAQYKADWSFDIIGMDGVQRGHEAGNVIFHGRMAKAEYQRVISQSDIAIGSLALHRIGLEEACPIKVREYLAYGIPTIIAYSDTDFPCPPEFILQLDNREDNVIRQMDAIEEFIDKWRGRRVPREEVLHLDIRDKEATRLEFMSRLRAGCR